eukprot:6364072-Pyramimonas_sp.AAC.1
MVSMILLISLELVSTFVRGRSGLPRRKSRLRFTRSLMVSSIVPLQSRVVPHGRLAAENHPWSGVLH